MSSKTAADFAAVYKNHFVTIKVIKYLKAMVLHKGILTGNNGTKSL